MYFSFHKRAFVALAASSALLASTATAQAEATATSVVANVTPIESLTPQQREARDLFKQMVEIPTVAGRAGEVERLIALLSEKFRAEGIDEITTHPHDDVHSMILRWRAPHKTDKKPILLLAHLDVVEAKRSDWIYDPFTLREGEGYYWGRGTVDNKAGALAITMSLIRLKRAGFVPQRDIFVLFTGNEETAGSGARLAASDWLASIDFDFVLNSDAGGGAFNTDGRALGFSIQTAEKLYRTYSFTVRNRGGHSSRPRADNAIYDLAAALQRLEKHRFAPVLNETSRAYFAARQAQEQGALGDAMRRWLADESDGEAADIIEADEKESGKTRTRCVATRLAAGHADNALPQLAQATVNCRIIPGETPQQTEATLKAIAGDKVEVAETDRFGDASPASPLRADVLGAYRSAIHRRFPNVPIVPHMSPGATDGLFFRAAGFATYGVGGHWLITPTDDRAHGLDERIPIRALHDNIDIWFDMLNTLAG